MLATFNMNIQHCLCRLSVIQVIVILGALVKKQLDFTDVSPLIHEAELKERLGREEKRIQQPKREV